MSTWWKGFFEEHGREKGSMTRVIALLTGIGVYAYLFTADAVSEALVAQLIMWNLVLLGLTTYKYNTYKKNGSA